MRSLIAIQDGQISLEQIKQLEAALRDLYRQHVGPDKLTVIWNVADAQHTITDRKWSRSSSCSVAVPDGFSNDKRETFLLELDRTWRAITGQHPDQTSFVAFDNARFQEVMNGNLERLSPLGRLLFLTRMTFRLMRSKRRNGVLITRFNQ
ncbi:MULTISPECIES: hypothetical protein [unclassified Ruegeria]|uniref:hypothetical protein n=1 Tax=unclassified Ruegeria TaxID=2625375 RepID=UPI001AD96D61|nr:MULTISPECIES: hypothetical protein [unclassified Ruegeria]MBO9413575.1 hypothetical protein [Ruegeria sp. R8_1]MBO9417242.1 hypothetical protein [Ruegeria sp. R8_2]